MGYYNSFVVKVWTDDVNNTLRGQIWHVNSHKQSYFDELDKAMVFIRDNLNPLNGSGVLENKDKSESKSNRGVIHRDG